MGATLLLCILPACSAASSLPRDDKAGQSQPKPTLLSLGGLTPEFCHKRNDYPFLNQQLTPTLLSSTHQCDLLLSPRTVPTGTMHVTRLQMAICCPHFRPNPNDTATLVLSPHDTISYGASTAEIQVSSLTSSLSPLIQFLSKPSHYDLLNQ